MHDTARLTKKGIPTVTIVWDTFEVPARTQARIFGVEDAPLLIIPHLEPEERADDVRRRAEGDVEGVLALLTAVHTPVS